MERQLGQLELVPLLPLLELQAQRLLRCLIPRPLLQARQDPRQHRSPLIRQTLPHFHQIRHFLLAVETLIAQQLWRIVDRWKQGLPELRLDNCSMSKQSKGMLANQQYTHLHSPRHSPSPSEPGKTPLQSYLPACRAPLGCQQRTFRSPSRCLCSIHSMQIGTLRCWLRTRTRFASLAR